MYSTNRLDLPTVAPTRRADIAARRRVSLPRRIDVHRIDGIVTELTEARNDGAVLDVDGSAVEMIDAYGLAALDDLARVRPLAIRNASVALAKTAEYTRHQRLHAACAPLATFPKAA